MARKYCIGTATLFAFIFASRLAVCQHPPQPYDGIQAGIDAYQLGEEKRQANVGQQLYLNDLSRARLTPLESFGYGYRPFVSTLRGSSASLEYAYGYGSFPMIYGFGGYASGRPLTVFEPWPYVPSDIWGDLYIPRLRQPVAQVQTQIGPNRWESRPVYQPPITSRSVLPPVNSQALKNTSYSAETPSFSAPTKRIPSLPTKVRPTDPETPSPGPSIDDKPSPPRRRVF